MSKRIPTMPPIDEDAIFRDFGSLSISDSAARESSHLENENQEANMVAPPLNDQETEQNMDIDSSQTSPDQERSNVKRKAEELVHGQRSRKRVAIEYPDEPKILPEEFMHVIRNLGGDIEHVIFVFEKGLTMYDLLPYYGCFCVSTIANSFFSEAELNELHARGVIKLQLIEPCLRVIDITLEEDDDFIYVLKENWRFVCERRENELMTGDRVQLWAFRNAYGKLGLAMVKVKGSKDGIDKEGTSGMHDDDGFNGGGGSSSIYSSLVD